MSSRWQEMGKVPVPGPPPPPGKRKKVHKEGMQGRKARKSKEVVGVYVKERGKKAGRHGRHVKGV